jgi:type 1 glutamine amidotransferase
MLGVLAVAMMAMPAAGADKIKVLIIDGQNNHNWKATTPVLKEMLEKTGRFEVEVATTPAKGVAKEQWEKFAPQFNKYQVILSNYNGESWPADVNTAFEQYMRDGGGLVIYHAANNAFTGWEAWTKMVGLLWQGPNGGDRITVDDQGKMVRTPKGEGPGAGHGPQHEYEVMVRDREHPITKGLPQKWTHAKDELYHGQRGPGLDMHILLTAFSDKSKGGTGANEPLAWTIPCGKGRVFVHLLGHDQTSVVHPGCVALTVRGAEWAATGQVTIAAPAEIK